jgi:hypothetical protein
MIFIFHLIFLFFMGFFREPQIERIHEAFSTYYSGVCPFCASKNWRILETWIHRVQDLGAPSRKRIVEIEMKRIECLNETCKAIYTPEHPLFPKNYQFSFDVIQYSLTQAHRFTNSAEKIAIQLFEQHQVTIDPKTIQSWINEKSEEYFQAYFQAHPDTAKQDFKAITIDGTWFNKGKDLIGKKKDARFSSVTKLADGTYLLTWWE